MSKKNYTNYNKQSQAAQVEPVETESVVETAEVESVETVVETEVTEQKIEPKKNVYGTIANCTLVNIRKKPTKTSEVLSVLRQNSKVTIDTTKSNDEWYNVTTKDGINGYVMKAYVLVSE